MANQYTAGQRPIARTITRDGRLIAEHYKGSSLESRFKYFVSVYYVLWNRHIQMVNNQGEILYDTTRGDCVPEVSLVKRTRLDRLPLLVSKLKTEEGRAELSKRLRSQLPPVKTGGL
jgi:hypothetical protein